MRFYSFEGDCALENYARELEGSADYRVLRRLPRLEEVWLAPTPVGGPAVVLAVVDSETTGLGENDKMIELAVVRMGLTEEGQLCMLEPVVSQFEDPGFPLSPEIQRLTGISDDMLAGQKFNLPALACTLQDVDALVAANASFDSGCWNRRFGSFGHPWICALRDFDWAAEGHTERSQVALLAAKGHFYPAHRATEDAWALAMLLAMQAKDGRTVAANLVDAGRRSTFRLAAAGAPFSTRDLLKTRGFRWNPTKRVWSTEVEADALLAEQQWLSELHPSIRPEIEQVNWFNRHTS